MAYLFPYAGAERRSVVKVARKPVLPKPAKLRKNRVVVTFTEVPFEVPKAPPRMKEILREVCQQHSMLPQDLIGRSRREVVVRARRDFIVRAKDAGYSFVRIGKALGGRDHTTILYHYHCYKTGAELRPDEAIY